MDFSSSISHRANRPLAGVIVLDFGQIIAQGEPRAVMASREVREIYLGALQ